MKKIVTSVSVLLLAVLLFSLCGSAWAENTSTYKVRIYSGNQGVFSGGVTVIERTLDYGATVSVPAVTVTDERFYVKGIREAGKDNATYNATDLTVKRDIDYVVAYGMKSKAVAYTVNYISDTGTTLLASQTFYGNVGDKPVVAFRYVEGYQPQAYNLTKTLSANAADNVFTFTYSPTTPETTTIVVPGNGGNNAANNNAANNAANNAGNNAANNNAANNAANNNAANNAANNAGNNAANNAGTGTATPATPAVPEEILDLDVPLAGPETPEATVAPSSSPEALGVLRSLPAWLLLLLLVGISGLITIPIIFFLFLRKDKNDRNQSAEYSDGKDRNNGVS